MQHIALKNASYDQASDVIAYEVHDSEAHFADLSIAFVAMTTTVKLTVIDRERADTLSVVSDAALVAVLLTALEEATSDETEIPMLIDEPVTITI